MEYRSIERADGRPASACLHFDPVSGLLNRSAFSSPQIHQSEMAGIFRRCWLFVGPANWVKSAGDFFTTSMAGDDVVVWRGRDGRLRAFYDRCKAGEGRIFREERGNTAVATCTCHGWRYTDGSADGRSDTSLIRVARIQAYAGLVFANCRDQGPDLIAQLGDFEPYLSLLLGGRSVRVESYGEFAVRSVLRANWKLPVEAHCGYAMGKPVAGNTAAPESPAGLSFGSGSMSLAIGSGAVVLSKDRKPLFGAVFPNLSIDRRHHTLSVWHPRGPTETLVDTYCVGPNDCGEDVRSVALRKCQFGAGPGSTEWQNRVVAWTSITAGASGGLSAKFPLNLAMGIGNRAEIRGQRGSDDPLGESNQRAFYGWWQDQLLHENSATPLDVHQSEADASGAAV